MKKVRDESPAPPKGAGFDDEARDVPVDWTNTGVLKVVPDEPVVDTEKV
jgi:hypothetical protein